VAARGGDDDGESCAQRRAVQEDGCVGADEVKEAMEVLGFARPECAEAGRLAVAGEVPHDDAAAAGEQRRESGERDDT